MKKNLEIGVWFSSRADGSMRIGREVDNVNKANREAYFKKNGIDPARVALADLKHGSEVKVVGKEEIGKVLPDCDGLLTREKNCYLALTVADCLPVFFYDPVRKVVGIAHGGWRGLAKGIVAEMVDKMKLAYSCKAQDLCCWIGPSICSEHYWVDEELLDEFSPSCRKFFRKNRQNQKKYFLDLRELARSQMLELGVKRDRIEVTKECTYELPEKYFSFRRDKPEKIQAMLAVISLSRTENK